MARYDILSQYIWPDGAPTAIDAEQLRSRGADVVLVGPSKLWNSLAAGRRILYSGFAGAMQAELEASVVSRY
ncbi:MAG TPA: hypothetical protein VN883_13960 [Myxococcales bacterium]|jgi:hypothetical protein|nr:hypothetical protein [Myxococcales bacterium]